MHHNHLAPNEAIQLREIIGMKSLCIQKEQVYMNSCQNPQLQQMIQQTMQRGMQQCQQIDQFLK
ncbi:spore coat protein CotF [Desulfitispora alkaliphila]|uniref:hypothetical protein n=1 Tax=Desulfitispora alkaliphila TaxID=622674 RepID=UPI003D21E92F